MDTFFQDNPYQATGETDLEQDARLALHLVMFLDVTRDPSAGNWPGNSPLAALRNTCHAVEALYAARLGHYSAALIDMACAWLINLPDAGRLSRENEDELRLFPSRFKTLAWLERFEKPTIQHDFEMLHRYLGDDGLIHRVLADPLLATMVYADCLIDLAPSQKNASWQEGQRRALDAIARSLAAWEATKDRPDKVLGPGQLSYALEVLIRAGWLTDADRLERIRVALINALHSDARWADRLYCGIELAEHFAGDPEATQAVREFLRDLHRRYEQRAWRQETSFHALMLRFLSTVHKEQLGDELIHMLLTQEQKRWAYRRQALDVKQRESFAELIDQRLRVHVNEVMPLAGGWAGTKIFRVNFYFTFTAMGDANQALAQQFYPNPPSLVIKVAETEALRRSIARYHELPDEVRRYAARHADEPFVVTLNGQETGCLVMEDLTHMVTLDDLLQTLDQPALSQSQERRLARACEAVCRALWAIHSLGHVQEFYGSQIARLYIAPIESALNRLADRYPVLKPWLRGFRLGERRYPSIVHYLNKIRGHESKLSLVRLMMTHGDAHSRNLMLDQEGRQAKLIDLDTLYESGDYVQDCALLLEDVCIYRFVRDPAFRFYLDPEQIAFYPNSDDPKAIGDGLVYPPPNAHSELSLLFQRKALDDLADVAQGLKDDCWQARLWLATATALIKLASNQRTLKRAAVLYAETTKLLDTLVFYLEEKGPLPPLLFPGKQPPGVERPPSSQPPA